jgi:coenzyme F420 hydrogenase subunit delta
VRKQEAADSVPEHCAKPVVVLGCGNVLFGDDGFGPAVAQRLRASQMLPAHVAVFDAGTAVRDLLFDMVLGERRPLMVVIVDAVDVGREPGEVFEMSLDEVPTVKTSAFSPHQAPTSNLLRDLRDNCGVGVVVVACQVGHIPQEVWMGLSPEVEEAVGRAIRLIRNRFLCRGRLAGQMKATEG